MMKVSDWDQKSIIQIIDGKRIEFKKREFILNKRSPVTLPDPRSESFKDFEAIEWLSRDGWKVLALRCVRTGVPFDGVFVDCFEAYVFRDVYFMIQHIHNRRVLRGDGRLVDYEVHDLKMEFDTRDEAAEWLKKTDVIPEQYKWKYFEIKQYKRSLE